MSRRGRLLPLLLLMVLAASSVLLGSVEGPSQETPAVPDPDRSIMEPQVAAKIEEHRQAVVAQPDSPEAWGKLGMVLHAHGFEREAFVCYENAANLDPTEFRWPYLAAQAVRGDDPAKAVVLAERASELMPYYSPIFVLRGELLEQGNEMETAKEQYEQAIANDSRCTPAEAGLGRLYLLEGDLEASLRHLLRAVEISKNAGEIHSTLVRVYRRMGDMEKAKQEAQLARELAGRMSMHDPVIREMTEEDVSSIALLERAMEVDSAGDYEEAEARYRGVLAIRPTDPNILERLATVLVRRGELDEAKELYQKALELKPENPAALYGLGNVLGLQENLDEAAEMYRKSLDLNPDHVPTLVNLGNILVFRGELDEAAAAFYKVLDGTPGSGSAFTARRQLAEIGLRQKKFDDAVTHLRAALDLRPNDGELHFQLALALADTGEFEAAWNHAEEAGRLGVPVPEELLRALKERLQR